MQYAIVAAGLAATAFAAYAPPAYEAPPVYSAAPVYNATESAAPTHASSAPAYVSSAPVYTTEVVSSYETYCPGPTTLTYASQVYTVTEATTLTITNCPCTVTKPVYTAPAVETHPAGPAAPPAAGETHPAAPASPAAPAYPGKPDAPAPASPASPAAPVNGTKPAGPAATTPVAYTGAASAVSVGAAGLLAVFGLVAAL
ncbi:unnamed protein product [Zymoseptoria tritici ST99CH_1A5]|uniref:Cell wall protein SED1 n=2 Tax=Zymoseptoria tritici TaxID=1047171 RepID=A0A2H1GIZ2_ZYMTR|nr:unnamed protein product [Zymoseptoria tritici ST99CH_1E4]SMR55912.1 unnamed protein product [Zymoseptoria tritici ST99CH_3D1]SMY25102.1 unnamed protein product [Zymoseptoria tritici ST99CH_1A5]